MIPKEPPSPRDKKARRRWRKKYGRDLSPSQHVRKEVLEVYGHHTCACCGEKREPFLAIDHIDGKTPEGDKKLRGNQLYCFLRDHHWPKGYRVLCHNCNFAIRLGAPCPHTWKNHKEIPSPEPDLSQQDPKRLEAAKRKRYRGKWRPPAWVKKRKRAELIIELWEEGGQTVDEIAKRCRLPKGLVAMCVRAE